MRSTSSGVPAGHGEVIAEPAVSSWAELARASAAAAHRWDFHVAGQPVGHLRREARRTLVGDAFRWSSRLGIRTKVPPVDPEIVIAAGHQPDLYHTGVWAKNFLLQRLSEETGATGIDLVVDSDIFGSVGMNAPYLNPDVMRRRHDLAFGAPDLCFAGASVPDSSTHARFLEAIKADLLTLPEPSILRNFEQFALCLQSASAPARNLAELITAARRCYEGHRTDYLELSVVSLASSMPFLRMATDICLSAHRFAEVHNEELATHRAAHRIRSAAWPFPDLAVHPDGVDIPFWLLVRGRRYPLRVRNTGNGVEILSPRGSVTLLPHDPDAAVSHLAAASIALAPRALTLTLFARTFLADLFIHGIGGSRYDRVTDSIALRWWGVELPPFVTASLTTYLPLGIEVVAEEDLAVIDRRLHRLVHNPDEMLADVAFSADAEQTWAYELAREKRSLINALAVEGADRAALGRRIRSINEELVGLVAPLADELRATRQRLAERVAASDALTDRTYPFCLWNPQEVADMLC